MVPNRLLKRGQVWYQNTAEIFVVLSKTKLLHWSRMRIPSLDTMLDFSHSYINLSFTRITFIGFVWNWFCPLINSEYIKCTTNPEGTVHKHNILNVRMTLYCNLEQPKLEETSKDHKLHARTLQVALSTNGKHRFPRLTPALWMANTWQWSGPCCRTTQRMHLE